MSCVELSRKRLKNLMGKRTRFKAKIFFKKDRHRAVLVDVSIKEKTYAQHLNIFDVVTSLSRDKYHEQYVFFYGVPFTYKDKKGHRKYGISQVENLMRAEDDTHIDECLDNMKNKQKRIRCKKKNYK